MAEMIEMKILALTVQWMGLVRDWQRFRFQVATYVQALHPPLAVSMAICMQFPNLPQDSNADWATRPQPNREHDHHC
eukprot:4546084-Amphidinium_carterae.2